MATLEGLKSVLFLDIVCLCACVCKFHKRIYLLERCFSLFGSITVGTYSKDECAVHATVLPGNKVLCAV